MIKRLLQNFSSYYQYGNQYGNTQKLNVKPVKATFKKNKLFAGSALLLGCLLVLGRIELHAQQTVYWRNNAANGNWENGNCDEIGTNPSQWWYPGFAPNQARNRPDCNDGSTTRHNVIIDNNHETTMTTNTTFWGLRSLTFENTATSNRTINSSPDDNTRGIGLTNGIYNNANSGITHTFNTRIGIDATTVTLSTATSGATTNYNREIFGNSNSIVFSGSGATNVAAVISGSGATVTKNGSGTLTFSGSSANTYTGTTTVNAGLLVLNKSAGVVAIPSTLTVASGATVRTDAANQWGTGTPPLVTINGNGILNLNNNNQRIALASTSATASVTLGSAILEINNTGTDTYAGVISGTGGVNKTNTGIQVLSGTNTYTGTTTITGGTLRLGAANVIADASNVVLNGGTLSTGATTGFTETVGTLDLNANSTIALGTGAHTLTFANSSALPWAGSLLTITGWTGPNNGVGGGTAGKIFIGNSASGLTSSQLSKIVFDISGVLYSAVQLNTGEIVASGATPLYYGGANAAWNTANWSTNNAAPYTSPWVDGRHAIFNIASPNLTGATVNFPYLTVNENATITTTGGTIGTAGQTSRMFVASGRTMDFSTNAFSASATFGIIKNGPGTLALTGNTYGGGFTLNDGLVVARGVNAMGGNAGPLNINGGTIGANAARDFSGKYSVININGDFTLGSSLAPAVGTANLTFNTNTALGSSVTRTITLGGTGTYTWNGVISGTGSNLVLAATAAGTLSLGGANTYGGNTTINGGTLQCGAANTLPSTTGVSLANTAGATLALNNFTQTIASLSGGGTTGGNITTGGTGGILTVNQSTNTTYAGVISGTGGLTKTGTGTLTLTNTSHTYTGATTITNGELRLNPTANATFASQVVLNGGTLATTGIASSTNFTSSSTLDLNANSTINLGSNVHTLTFANSSGVPWAGTLLTINGWTGTGGSPGTAGRIFFGNDNTSLTAAQLAKISFTGYPGTPILLPTGELVPSVPPNTYTWTGNNGSAWDDNLNWSPNTGFPTATDNVIIPDAGSYTNELIITGTRSCLDFTVNANGTYTMGAGSSLTVSGNYTYNSSTAATFNCTSTLNIAGAASQTIPAANYGNLNISGGPRILANSGTIGICGTFTPGSGGFTITGSTIDFNGTGAQTINAFSYNNLTISGARTINNVTLAGGTINVAGTFSPTATFTTGNYVVTGNTINYNGPDGQTIVAFNYNNLSSTNNNRTLQSSGNIGIAGTFTPGTGTYTTTGSTVVYNGLADQTVSNFTSTTASRSYHNLVIEGTGLYTPNRTWNGTGIGGITGNMTINAGNFRQTTTNGGTTFIINGNLNITSSNARFAQHSGNLSTNNTHINGNFNISGGRFDFNTNFLGSGSGFANLRGNLNHTGGLIMTSGSSNGVWTFDIPSPGTQTLSSTTGNVFFYVNAIIGGADRTLSLLSNVNVQDGDFAVGVNATLNAGSFVVTINRTGGTRQFRLNSNSTLRTTASTGVLGNVNLIGGATAIYNAAANYQFEGNNQSTGFNTTPAITTMNSLTWLGTGNLTLDRSVDISGPSSSLNFTNDGLFLLGNFNLTLATATTLNGAPFSATKMFVTNGTGYLRKAFTATATFTWPIGDNVGVAEYSPATLTVNPGIGGTVGLRVIDAVHPNNAPATNYLSRYWNATMTSASYSWNGSFTYVPADIVGTESSLKLNIFDPNPPSSGWTEYAASSAASNVLTVTTGPGTGSLNNTDITGRQDVPLYYRSVASGLWNDVNSWESSSDPAFISPAPVTPVAPPNNANSAGILVRSPHVITVNSTVWADDLTSQAGSTLTIDAGGNFTLANGTAPTDFQSDGIFNVNNTTTFQTGAGVNFTGNVNVNSSAFSSLATVNVAGTTVYTHNVNGGSVITATWADNSELRITGVTNSGLTGGLSQSFWNVVWNCSAQSAAINLATNPITTVRNNFTVQNTNSNDLRLYSGATGGTTNIDGKLIINSATARLGLSNGGGSSSATVTVNVSGNVEINAGLLTMTGSTTQTAINNTLNIGGDLILNGGNFDFNSTNSVNSGNQVVNLSGNLTINSGQILRSFATTSTNFRFNKTTGNQTYTAVTPATAVSTNPIVWNLGNGTTQPTLILASDFVMNGSATFTVNTLSTIDFGTNIMRGTTAGTNGSFALNGNSTLRTGNADGIVAALSATTGSVQTGTAKTFSATAHYIYNGSVDQTTGTGLPLTLTSPGQLTINNTGSTVTLTTTNTTTPTLNLQSGFFAIGAFQTLNISSGGVVNATGGDFATGAPGGTINFLGSGAFNGNSNPYIVQTSGGLNFGAQTVTIQNGGAFRINAGGFVSTNGPFYASGSTLIYNTGGNYGRGLEWNSASGRGFPHHVTLSNSTNLNPARPDNSFAATTFNTGGTVTINSGSGIYLDFGGNNMTVPLNIGGDLILIGGLSGSGALGGDINIAGDWLNFGTSHNFFPNNRQVAFIGTSDQIMGGTNANALAWTFNFLAMSNTGGNITMNFPITVTNRLQMNNGKLIIGNNNLVLTGSAFFDNGGVNSYVVTNGTGTVRQVVNTGGGNEWYPIGPTTTIFAPVTLQQSGTTDDIAVIVKTAPPFTNAVNDNNLMVNLEWNFLENTAGGNNLRTQFGWQIGSEATSFDRTSAVYHGHWNGTKYIVRGTNATTGTDPYFSLSTAAQNYTGNLINQRFVVGNLNGIIPCIETIAAGEWNTPGIWDVGFVPPTESNVCLKHAVTLTTIDPPNPSGIIFQASSSLNIAAGRKITFESPAFLTNSSGVAQNLGAGAIEFSGLGVVNGSQPFTFGDLIVNGNTTLTTTPTVSNSLEIKTGGFIISGTSLNYGPSSTLIYNTGGSYNRSNEWNATSGAGYPNNVLVTGNTSLNVGTGTAVNRAMAGNLTVNAGSSISQGSSTFPIVVPGNFTLNGSYTQSTSVGGDMILGGNWNSGASATLTSNNRDVRFNGSAAQTISTASIINFGFLTIDNTADAVSLLSDIRAFTFKVNASRTFNLTASNKISILSNGNIIIDGTFNANNGTIEYLDGGSFTNNGTFNRGTSTIDFLPFANFTGFVLGTVQTNFHNIYLGSFSGIDFNSGPLRGKVSGTFQLRNGSFVSGNAPIYEPGSKLMYSGGGTFNRNVEWDPATVQKVEIRNNTTLKCGVNGTSFSHICADSLIIRAGSTLDMTGPDMTAPTVVGGTLLLEGTLNLSNAVGGELEVGGDWVNNGGTFNCNQRVTTMIGAANAQIKGSSTTTFCFLTIDKNINSTVVPAVPFIVSQPPAGTTLRIAGGILDLNGQTYTLGPGNNSLLIDEGFAKGQTLRTGGSDITLFTNYRNAPANNDTLGGKVDYSSSGAETLIAPVKGYFMLWLTGGSTKSITQQTRVKDSLLIAPSTTLDFGAGTFVLQTRGNIVNNGAVVGTGTGFVELQGTSTQNMSGSGDYRNLVCNNTANVNLSGEPTITNNITMTAGKIITGVPDTLHLTSTAIINESNQASGSFVRGNVKITKTVGVNADNFNGIGVQLTAGSNLGNVTVVRTSGAAIVGAPPCCNGFSGINRYFMVRPTVQPTSADRNITIQWPSDDDNGRNMNLVQMWKSPDNIQQYERVGFPQNVSSMNPRSLFYNNIPSFSFFTASDPDNPLPVTLLNFRGSNVNGRSFLTWSTTNERNNKGFEIQKSTNGSDFKAIGFVEALGENVDAKNDYTFWDENLTRDSYYRLRQIDNDGKEMLSHTVLVRLDGIGKPQFGVYPNPASKSVVIEADGLDDYNTVEMMLYSTEGKLLLSVRGTLSAINLKVNKLLPELSTGMYILKLQTEEVQQNVKLIKQ
jgi:autotransporter-associated beta strand protein